MEYQALTSQAQLRNVYDAPMELAVKKQQSQLDEFSINFLQLSPFCTLSTAAKSGTMDCSPRGDYPGFIEILDATTIALPDRPGNNRLDSLSNIVENPKVGILALIPGFKECLRINGTAIVTTDADLLKRCEHRGKLPLAVVVVTVKEVYFHCAKSITRSKLWHAESQVDRDLLPSLGKIIMAQVDPNKTDEEVSAIETLIKERETSTLY